MTADTFEPGDKVTAIQSGPSSKRMFRGVGEVLAVRTLSNGTPLVAVSWPLRGISTHFADRLEKAE